MLSEINRLRVSLNARDARTQELEKIQQENRNTIQKLKEGLACEERRVQELETSLNAESQNKKRLESRLLSLESNHFTKEDTAMTEKDLLPSKMPSAGRQSGTQFQSPHLKETSDFSRMATSLDAPGGPIRQKSLLDQPLLGSESAERVTAALAARFNSDSGRSRQGITLQSGPLTPNLRKSARSSKGLVSEVRDTIQAASRQSNVSDLGRNNVDGPSSGVDEYELSIERTKQFLRQRLAPKSNANASSASKAGPVHLQAPGSSPSSKAGAIFLFDDDECDDDQEEGRPAPISLKPPQLHSTAPP